MLLIFDRIRIKCIHLLLQQTMVERILKRASESTEKRADDNEATIKNRIETFIKNTDKILNQYPNQTIRVIVIFFNLFDF